MRSRRSQCAESASIVRSKPPPTPPMSARRLPISRRSPAPDCRRPGGFCLTAAAYRAQIAALGLETVVAEYADADVRRQRRLSVDIRLALYQRPIAPEMLNPLLAAWRAQRASSESPARCAPRR